MTQFKIGDRIRAKASCDNDYAGGEAIVISLIGDSENHICFTKSSKYYDKHKVISPCLEYWELISDVKPEVKNDKPVVLHLVLKDSCNNIIGSIKNSFDEAEKQIPLSSEGYTIYKLVPIAKAIGKLRVTKIK